MDAGAARLQQLAAQRIKDHRHFLRLDDDHTLAEHAEDDPDDHPDDRQPDAGARGAPLRRRRDGQADAGHHRHPACQGNKTKNAADTHP